VIARLKDWLRAGAETALGPLARRRPCGAGSAAPPAVRALLAMLVDEGGIVARDAVAGALAALARDQRRRWRSSACGSARSTCSCRRC
jgi:ATP-dependent RNA helicase SUPV3L1/SUV3